jgi:AraC-like DNA-binding protein
MTRGAFRRRVDGFEQFVDPGSVLVRRAGLPVEVMEIGGRQHVTVIEIDRAAFPIIEVASWPEAVVADTPVLDHEHRALLRSFHETGDALDVELLVGRLVVRYVDAAAKRDLGAVNRRLSGQHRAVAAVCELLHHDTAARLTLTDLSQAAGYSPFHLSRLFHAARNVTMGEYRLRVRVHRALQLLGEDASGTLADVAQITGFADHAHLTRTLVALTGRTPSRLRAELRNRQLDWPRSAARST